MKKILASLIMVAMTAAAFAQGTVTFNTVNLANTTLGQTFLPGGTTGPGATYVGQLYWSDSSAGSYVAAGTPQTFSAANPQYIADGSVSVPAHDGGATVWFQMRVWNSAAGASYEAALGSQALVAYGTTAVKSRVLGGLDSDGNPFAPASFNTFANLTLTPVPEPSTIALAGLGAAALMIFRRRK